MLDGLRRRWGSSQHDDRHDSRQEDSLERHGPWSPQRGLRSMKISLNDPAACGDEGPVTISFAIAGPPDDVGEEVSQFSRLAAGDPQAIDEVYRQHHAALRGFANRFLGDASAAEDVVHDVFVVLPGAIRKFRGDSSL